jgi:hypothetical protein
MENQTEEFIKGYDACLTAFKATLASSIRKNNGATTFQDVLQVYNDIVHWSHIAGNHLEHAMFVQTQEYEMV